MGMGRIKPGSGRIILSLGRIKPGLGRIILGLGRINPRLGRIRLLEPIIDEVSKTIPLPFSVFCPECVIKRKKAFKFKQKRESYSIFKS